MAGGAQDVVPLYEQVRRRLLAEIDSGRLPEGSFLPPEAELCAAHGVSRITLRRAVGELCAEGRLIRQQGRGTLVAPRKITQSITLSGFSDIIEGLGRRPGHRILAQETDAAAPDALAAAQPVRFERLLEVDARPMTLEVLWFDAGRFPAAVEAVAAGDSFFAALRQHYGLVPAGAERRIDVGFASGAEAAVLAITPAQPVYRMEKTVFDAEGRPLSLSRLVTPCHLVTLTLRS